MQNFRYLVEMSDFDVIVCGPKADKCFRVNGFLSIQHLKTMVGQEFNISADYIGITKDSIVLEENKSIDDYSITPSTKLRVVVKPFKRS